MTLSDTRRAELEALCRKFRIDVLTALHEAQSGHPGGSLSVCEILTVIYFEKARLDSSDPGWADRDRIVLSKGHAAPMLYRILAEKGYFPLEEMKTLRKIDSLLQGHPSMHTPGVEFQRPGVLSCGADGYPKKLDVQMLEYTLSRRRPTRGAVGGSHAALKFKLDNLTHC